MRKLFKTILGFFLAPTPPRQPRQPRRPRAAASTSPVLRDNGRWVVCLHVHPYPAPVPYPGDAGRQVWPPPPMLFGYGTIRHRSRPVVCMFFQLEERRFSPLYFPPTN